MKQRWLFVYAAAGLLALSAATTPLRADPIVFTYYSFVGDCTDCTGQGVGTLKLADYTPGSAFTLSNFVEFTYSSNLLPSWSVTEVVQFTGLLPAVGLPGHANLFFEGTGGGAQYFSTDSSGDWCVQNSCADYGTNGVWALQSSVPEPGSILLTGTGMATVAAIVRRRRRLAHLDR